MTHEDFLQAENDRNISTSKAYKAHLKEIQKLTERQVVAQEGMVQNLAKILEETKNETRTNTETAQA